MKTVSAALTQAHRRVELLNALMRWKRANLTRSDVGLAPRSGARAGLTQDDLAEVTGYTVRIINQLEHGRIRTPSLELLEAVANALVLSPDERRTFWLLAAGAMPPPGSYVTGPDVGLTKLINQLYPHPAYVTDAMWNVQAYNQGVAEWFVDFAQLPAEDRNIAKWILIYPHARHAFVNWQHDFANVFLSRMRAVAARFPDDERLSGLIRELRERSDYFAQAWDADSGVYLDPPTETRVFRRPGHTDPDQPDDPGTHVPIDMVILGPMRPDDERRIVAFLLPGSEPHRPHILSGAACTVCTAKPQRAQD